ncbi:alpha/beta hydrolase [Streptomyces sp. ME19-01-6]|uniref:alpha/beta fold hydrolase n=1 Tax=Streptomyces sp. ME19-01-6 TaxID=3028686 RepID=UPI0029BA9065|nr:alpha/beta hydrolase [Streptomyces sp. ME19-01-6]MDX3224424.1 alpha/beta hydrolase [Streptomyces sp. ME19-01-6]
MTNESTRTGTLDAPGATLHYQVRGDGPVLLIGQSGEGDADRSVDLAARLADTYTVVTYDRRGLSRSRLHDPSRGATLAEHADDAARVLATVTPDPAGTPAPAAMLGCSLGAVIGLHLAVRHPGRIHTLIAHEPVAPRLLPATERTHHEHELAHLQRLYARDGLAAALPEIARVLGIDTSGRDSEPGLTPQPINALRRANFDYFIRHDFTAVLDDTLDISALANTPTRIVPAVGRTTPDGVFDRRCAYALADALGTEVIELPGGHNGNTSHPSGYAASLRDLLPVPAQP